MADKNRHVLPAAPSQDFGNTKDAGDAQGWWRTLLDGARPEGPQTVFGKGRYVEPNRQFGGKVVEHVRRTDGVVDLASVSV